MTQIYFTPRWRDLRKRVFRRDRYRCRSCGRAGRLECDHIQPVREGGDPWNTDNLQTLCRSCHSKKTRRENPYRRRIVTKQELAWRDYLNELLSTSDN